MTEPEKTIRIDQDLYMLNGLGLNEDAEEELDIVKQFPAETPKGEQLQLF